MNTKIKFKELLAMIPEKSKGKVPTYKHLTETEEPMLINSDGSVRCYPSGYAAYSSVSGKTVFSVFDCDTYTYESEIGEADVVLSREQIAEMKWDIPLVLLGESRTANNLLNREVKHRHFLGEDNDIEDFAGSYDDSSPADSIREYCKSLTEKQKQVIELYFVYEYSQREIAEILGIHKSTVQTIVERAIKKIRRIMQSDDFS